MKEKTKTTISLVINVILAVGLISAVWGDTIQQNGVDIQQNAYNLDQASKRVQLGVYPLVDQYSISQNSSNNIYEGIFNVSGTIVDDGQSTCTIVSLSLNISLTLTNSMKQYHNMTSAPQQCIENSNTFVNCTSLQMLRIGDIETFNLSMPFYNLDNHYPNLQNSSIQGNILVQYTDDSGMLTKNVPVTGWVQISS